MNFQYFLKRNASLAFPVMLSQLGHVFTGVADSMMVGRLGVVPLAASAFGHSVVIMFMTFGIGLSYGMTPLVAANDGLKNHSTSAEILKNGFLINLATGLLLSMLIYFSKPLLVYFNQPPEVLNEATSYLIILGFSLIPLMIFQTFRQFAEGFSLTRPAMFVSIAGNGLNILLNYVLIFGKGGFPELGLNGAGYATLISRIFMALAMGLFILKNKNFGVVWENFSNNLHRMKIFTRILKLGIPSALQFVLEGAAFGFGAIMVGWLGAVPLAAHQIAMNLATITYMTASGVAAAATITVGNQYGLKDLAKVRIAGFSAFVLVIIIMSFGAIFFLIFNHYLPKLYIEDTEVISVASGLIIVAAFFQLFDGVQVVAMGALRGLTDVTAPTIVAAVSYWVIGIPVGYFLAFYLEMNVIGLWYGFLIGLGCVSLLLFRRFSVITKKR